MLKSKWRVYQVKLSGPLMDRIDLHVEVPALHTAGPVGAPPSEPTQSIRARCTHTRERATQRQGKPNQALAGREIDLQASADAAAQQFLQTATAKLGWSARGTHRTLKIARTIVDLARSENTQLTHVAEAMQYSRSTP